MTRRAQWLNRLGAIAFAVFLLAIWQLLAALEVISPLFFPSPARTLGELWSQIVNGQIWSPFFSTVLRMFYGWVVASLLGVVLGALIAGSLISKRLFAPILEFLRPMPASAIIPVAILAFGLSNTMSTAVIAFGSIWPVLLAAVQGFSSVEPRLLEMADAMRMTAWDRFRKVSLPSAMPDILAGARVGLAIALILAVVTEMQASLPGLGQSILMAQRSYRTPELYAGVVMLGVIGFGASMLLQWIERRILRWRSVQ
ncbi:ABC transporter permease [Pusillimonas sp.]|uniref:ABC transporter permease n=1 Tax=Pusillimonas sp. TaxID=3040095 RepID=UPI0037CB7FE6